jgi:hypothetical protein
MVQLRWVFQMFEAIYILLIHMGGGRKRILLHVQGALSLNRQTSGRFNLKMLQFFNTTSKCRISGLVNKNMDKLTS